jgi:hypothetical protein
LVELGIPAAIRVPAGARLEWMTGSPEIEEETATVRVTHALDPDDGLLRERGLRLFVRAPVRDEATELAAFEAFLREEPARIAAETAAAMREIDEAERELRVAGLARDRAADDELADEMLDTPMRLEIAHRHATGTGWEMIWTLEEDGAYTVKVWRADLGLFCLDVLATREAALRVLDVCRTLAPG